MHANNELLLKCSCGAVELKVAGSPAACGYCHCGTCRDFYGLPVFAATAWNREHVEITKGKDRTREFIHPTKQVRRYFCVACGETLFGTNRLGMAVIGTPLISKAFGHALPAEFQPTFHLFYAYRVLEVEDKLPKYLEGRNGLTLQRSADVPDAPIPSRWRPKARALTFMESSGVNFPFEFCALRYLLQWQRKEAALHARVKHEALELTDVRKALKYFQVARNFKGFKQDERAETVRVALISVRTDQSLSPTSKVEHLARAFKEAGFQHNLSAASKLLWFSSRKPFVIFDSRALVALETEFDHSADPRDYVAYCTSWKRAYRHHKKAIVQAVNRLPEVRAFLPGDTPADAKLLELVNKQWFLERVFDLYLWELGGDG